MATCKVCNKNSNFISKHLGVCLKCIRESFSKSETYIRQAHLKVREDFGFSTDPLDKKEAISCSLCVNECRISEEKESFCGLRKNIEGRLVGPNENCGSLSFYFDWLPTNCVASFCCAAIGSGYPEFSYIKGPEYGYKNLSVFYNGCSFNCLFCQNWHYRVALKNLKKTFVSAEEVVSSIDEKTACICFFGGDPSCQLPNSIAISELALANKKNKILRICWETNGSMRQDLLKEIIDIALKTGGCIKFDLKAFAENLNIALCGVSNKRTLENFSYAASFFKKRKYPPLVVASTLLIPGYIDEYEIEKISSFIANLDKDIPYSLLAFYPCFYMKDLPKTEANFAYKCRKIALKSGLNNVKIENIHLFL